MMTTKEHNQITENILSHVIAKWRLLYGGGLVGFALTCVALVLWRNPVPTDEVVFYPWIIGVQHYLMLISFCGIALGLLLYLIRSKVSIQALMLSGVTVVSIVATLAWLGPLIGRQFTSFEPDPTLIHIDRVFYDNRVYNFAADQAFPNLLGQAYTLYECDSFSIRCLAIFRYKPQSLDDVLADTPVNPPYLSIDKQQLAVHIAGKTVFSYPLIQNLPIP